MTPTTHKISKGARRMVTRREPDLPPCPNCGLMGGYYQPLAELHSVRLRALVSGFEIRCSICGAVSMPETTKRRVLSFWKKGDVLSAFEQEKFRREIAEVEQEIAALSEIAEGFGGLPTPYRGDPDDDIPF